MPKPLNDNPQNYPPLGRALLFLEDKKIVKRIVFGLVVLCAFLLGLDVLYERSTYLDAESIFGFYPLLGVLTCLGVAILCKVFQVILTRREDYYHAYSTDDEAHPAPDLSPEAFDD